MVHFKDKRTFEERKVESTRIMEKYPSRIPIICEKDPRSKVASIDKHKYLVPDTLTVSQFIHVIRKRISVRPDTALFVLVDGHFVSTSQTIDNLYRDYADRDGFLYMTYASENIFGV